MEALRALTEQVSTITQMVQDLAMEHRTLTTSHNLLQEELSSAVRSFQGPAPVSEVAQSSTSDILVISPEPTIMLPDKFSGEKDQFRTFRESCRLLFTLRPRSSGNESQRVGIVMSLLRGGPQTWAFSLPPTAPERSSVDRFFDALGLIYDEPDRVLVAEDRIMGLSQGGRTAEAYCSEFRQWSAEVQWNDSALRCQFRRGLSDNLKDALALHPPAASLEEAMTQAVRMDRRLRERRMTMRETLSCPLGAGVPAPAEPMEIGAASPVERERGRRREHKLCFYCGGSGHWRRDCPARPHSGKPSENV